VLIASRWSCAPPPRFDLIRAIREPRVPDSDPGGGGRRCLEVNVHRPCAQERAYLVRERAELVGPRQGPCRFYLASMASSRPLRSIAHQRGGPDAFKEDQIPTPSPT